MGKANDSKTRFTSRVDDYIKYRPKYPKEIITFLEMKGILTENTIIADIGSGTGFLSGIFLENGYMIYGVEPNKEMREAGEHYLQQYSNFHSIVGSAEETTLQDNSVDLITAGQAYHWFNPNLSKMEFKRILKDQNSTEYNCVLIWNTRKVMGSKFGEELELIIEKFSTDYKEVKHNRPEHEIESNGPPFKRIFFEDLLFQRELKSCTMFRPLAFFRQMTHFYVQRVQI